MCFVFVGVAFHLFLHALDSFVLSSLFLFVSSFFSMFFFFMFFSFVFLERGGMEGGCMSTRPRHSKLFEQRTRLEHEASPLEAIPI